MNDGKVARRALFSVRCADTLSPRTCHALSAGAGDGNRAKNVRAKFTRTRCRTRGEARRAAESKARSSITDTGRPSPVESTLVASSRQQASLLQRLPSRTDHAGVLSSHEQCLATVAASFQSAPVSHSSGTRASTPRQQRAAQQLAAFATLAAEPEFRQSEAKQQPRVRFGKAGECRRANGDDVHDAELWRPSSGVLTSGFPASRRPPSKKKKRGSPAGPPFGCVRKIGTKEGSPLLRRQSCRARVWRR